jgi:hypothetical protein
MDQVQPHMPKSSHSLNTCLCSAYTQLSHVYMEVTKVLTVAKNVTVMSFVPFGIVKKSFLTAAKKGLRSLRDSSTMGAKEPLLEPMMVCQEFNLSPRLAKVYTSR